MPYLYTIGYEGLTLDEFIDKLSEHHIQLLVDVRELPLSRKRGFSKNGLAAALGAAGILYQSARSLGSPRSLRHELRQTRDWATFTAGFMDYLQGQTEPLAQVIGQAYAESVCLMCYEHDSRQCHRSLVASTAVEIADNGLRVVHL